MTGTIATVAWAVIGVILCALIVTAITLLIIGLIWWMFRNDLDFEDMEYIEEGAEDREDQSNE